MRLDFNVLWVEDQQASVQAYRTKIYRSLRKEGFKLETIFATSVEEARQYLSSNVYGDHIDLVLMDYDLGIAPMGDEGLQVVREYFKYKDIIFYSADVGGLLKRVAEKNIQGIFCSTRGNLPDTVEEVFHVLVKKVVDIDHSRGIVMGATSDIDHLVNDCLQAAFEKGNAASRQFALSIVKKRVNEIRGRVEAGVLKASEIAHISELAALHEIYTSYDRLVLLQKVLATNKEVKDQCDAIKKYIEETLPKRNDLAHLRVERNGFSRRLVGRDGAIMTVEDMKSLRQSLLEFQETCEVLADALQ